LRRRTKPRQPWAFSTKEKRGSGERRLRTKKSHKSRASGEGFDSKEVGKAKGRRGGFEPKKKKKRTCLAKKGR